jgi:iron(III) transport system ATP-binding protein
MRRSEVAVDHHSAARQVPSVVVSGLTKRFGAKTAVDGIDLVIEPGTFVVLLGPSGSGKSTLLRCLAGIETPTSGTITFGDQVVDGPGVHLPPERRDLAMVFQDYALWPHLTAEANVAFALQRRKLKAPERRERARSMLEQVGLGELSGRYPGELSGGEQQRVALARALVAEPGLLLFDEPLSNLDADRREHLRIDISSMVRRHGATAIYITHDQAEAFALADRVGVLEQGRLVQFDTPEQVYQHPATPFVARFTGIAGELVGTVAARSGTFAHVDVDGRQLVGRAVGSELLVEGGRARVLVRPSAARLVEDDGPREPSAARLTGTVSDRAFRGFGYEHAVDVCGGHRLSAVASEHPKAIGETVEVELSPAGCLVVADDAPPAGGRRVSKPATAASNPERSALGVPVHS